MSQRHAVRSDGSTARLRIGVVLWCLSWVPYGVILGLSGVWLTVSWGVEVVFGISGLALAGPEFAKSVKANGWKGAPRAALHAVVSGRRES